MKILVCGGRGFGRSDLEQRRAIFAVLSGIHDHTPVTMVVHGNALGADRVAKRWAEVKGIADKGYDPDWDDISHPDAVIRYHAGGQPYDAAAGTRRNQHMLDEHPDIALVVAFPGGPGTADMCRRARKHGFRVECPLGQ